jgi:hypothetical protein
LHWHWLMAPSWFMTNSYKAMANMMCLMRKWLGSVC